MMAVIFHLFNVRNNVQAVNLENVSIVTKDIGFQIMNVMKFRMMDIALEMNNVMIIIYKQQMVIIVSSLIVLKIVNTFSKDYVQNVIKNQNNLIKLIIIVNNFVEMDIYQMMNNAMMQIIFPMMGVMNVNFNAIIIVIFVAMANVYNVDDGNLIPYDGCYECKFQCQEECIDCVKGVCNSCIDRGWILNPNHVCTNKCGDGITIDQFEQCDDGNDIPYDGCYQCEFQCELLCTLCEQGVCFECNQFGWIIQNNQCTSICGDGIVVGNEQCDDMNSIQNDGCYQCKFMCDQYCLDCQEGVCNECLQGMNLINQTCQPICGDGFHLLSFEQCDDANKDNGDGCDSQCQIENDWICITNASFISVCLISKQPDFNIIVLTPDPQQFCDVQIQFNQQVKLSSKIFNDLNENIVTTIINLQQENYSIQLTKEIKIAKNELTDLVLSFRIQFLSTIEHPVFQIEFQNDPLISEYNQTLTKSQGQIELSTPIFLAQTEIQIAEQASGFNQAIIISLASLSSICLLTGQSDIFWNLMDQLQYLSYVKYVNIDFSPNLNIYFEVFKFVTISPLISALGIDKLFAALDGSEDFIVVTNYKFLKDDINAYFLLNFQSFLFCLITTYLSFYSAQIIYHLLKKIGHIQIKQLGFTIGKLVITFRTTLQHKISEFYHNAILRLLLSNSYDLSFACAIQLAYYPKTAILY
ncbi:unnamed protein product [Paramecium sonneborni]|uniref:Uncharacterized protein n=1 Tax=Paramecium sonneborni TaxID=65129 RepID=A0A8S1R1A5_9CILI|nr:unnamed protein product [Paramecium sonneborni]